MDTQVLDSQYRSPFEVDIDEEDVVKEEVIESFGMKVNFESKNDQIETHQDSAPDCISTDDINARKAFLYFNDWDLQKRGEETFNQKVERIQNELSRLKFIAKKRDLDHKEGDIEESKDEEKVTNVLQQIEALEKQTERIANPQLSELKSSKAAGAKPIESILSNLSINEKSEENVIYELMYNSDCKNLMAAAKISELKKRVNTIQKCLSVYDDKCYSKHKSISHLLNFTQDQMVLMDDKEVRRINDK